MQLSKQISKNYAQALIELAGGDLSLEETFLNEIKSINEIISQIKETKQIFENPGISKDEKKELIKNLFSGKINQNVLNFLFLLIDKQRFNILPDIQNWLNKFINNRKGIVIAEVTSALELDANTLENLKQKFETLLKEDKKVTIETKIEPALIGGLMVKINDLVYDGSIKGKLDNLKRRLG